MMSKSKGLYLSASELDKLNGLPYFAFRLYCYFRYHMDKETLITGSEKRRISYQAIKEELYIEPAPGRSGKGSPTISQIRWSIKLLRSVGLLKLHLHPKFLIVECLLAQTGSSNQNKYDRPTTDLSDRPVPPKTLTNSNGWGKQCNQYDRPTTRYYDTPQVSNNIYIYSTANSKNPTKTSSEKIQTMMSEILDFLNVQARTSYTLTQTNHELLLRLLKNGITDKQIKDVICMKTKEWLNTNYQKYLRPKTLFSTTNFYDYLGLVSQLQTRESKSTPLYEADRSKCSSKQTAVKHLAELKNKLKNR